MVRARRQMQEEGEETEAVKQGPLDWGGGNLYRGAVRGAPCKRVGMLP